jgi:hypothetical protein
MLWTGQMEQHICIHVPSVHLCELSQPYCRRGGSRSASPQGISQTLIVARIGFSRLRSPSKAAKRTAAVLASNHQVDEEERIDFVLNITKGGNDIEMCTTGSSTLA